MMLRNLATTPFQSFAAAAVVIAALPAVGSANAASVVVPDTAGEGNASSAGPFDPFGQRFQQVFAADVFSGGPVSLSAVAFRADAAATDSIDTTRGEEGFPVEVRLSTTSAAPDELSSLFDDNVGDDVALVFSGTLSFSSAGGDGTGPGPFDLGVQFDQSFAYDPASGNLLLEIAKFSSDIFATPLLLDAEETLGDATSSLSGLAPFAAQGANSTLGLVAQFEADSVGPQPIPTPTAAVLGLASMLGVLARRRSVREAC